jgi:glycyl-tRNA synthetase beta chain
MSELLIELFSEEIPASMQTKAAQGYQEIFTRYLQQQNIGFEGVFTYVSPRRLTIHITGAPSAIEANIITKKGPKTSASTSALEGFCRSNKIEKTQLKTQTLKGEEYFVFEQEIAEKPTKDILKTDLPGLISSYVWPKSMYWGQYKIKWVRPLKNILCIFDGKILDFEYGHLKTNDKSSGHRFMSPAPFVATNFANYIQQLRDNFVILDAGERTNYIVQQSAKLADEMGLVIKDDPELLEEVVGIVEYPQVLIGKIDEKFLTVPSEVLISSMRAHQKYFSLFDKKGNFAPYFLFVSNIFSTEPNDIIHGNEKVLSARLADALYFYKQDLKTTINHRVNRLDKVIFHTKLGSLKDKTARLVDIVDFLSPGNEEVKTAAMLCKNDIVSEVVGEFPNLQGIMGYYYAKHESLSEDVAISIRDHYKPQGASDQVPRGNAAILAIADKMDTLCGLVVAGEKPGGSKDPYALRRQALGIIKILIGNELSINIAKLIDFVVNRYSASNESHKQLILGFLEDRFKYFLKDKYSHELITAVLDFKQEPDLLEVQAKLQALKKFLSGNGSQDLLTAYRRAGNITAGVPNNKAVNESLLIDDDEKSLYYFIRDSAPKIETALAAKNYSESLEMLAAMKKPISDFFDNVMVKVKEQEIADNRLALLWSVKTLFTRIANFDKF